MKISIYGTGWLGKPLADEFIKNNWEVCAPRWRAETNHPMAYWKPLIESEIQVWSIPPRTKENGPDFYVNILSEWTNFLQNYQVKKIVFLSSTSVYKSSENIIHEDSEINEDSIISKAEKIIIDSGIPYLIIRLGGLMGGDRYVAKYYSGKFLERANGPVNYLHLEDAVSFLYHSIQNNLFGIYNLVAPEHPIRKEVVIANCLANQMPLPTAFLENENAPKIISSEKILKALQLGFSKPNPIDF